MRWPLQVVHPRQFGAEHLAVHEQQGAEGLVVRGRRNAPLRRKHGEERLNFRSAHIARMLQAVPSNEEAHPVEIGLLGAKAIVQIAHPLPHLVQQARGVEGGERTGRHGSADCIEIQCNPMRCTAEQGSRIWRRRGMEREVPTCKKAGPGSRGVGSGFIRADIRRGATESCDAATSYQSGPGDVIRQVRDCGSRGCGVVGLMPLSTLR